MRRILSIGPIAAAALVFAAAASAASPSPTYQLTGVAGGGPQASGTPFVGVAAGSTGDRASWRATVVHAALDGCAAIGSGCAVTGGAFTLTSSNGARIDGSFTGGLLTLTAQQPRCGSQTFAVTARVSASTVLEQFTGTLTQYRASVRGVCTGVVAIVQGTLAVADDGGSF